MFGRKLLISTRRVITQRLHLMGHFRPDGAKLSTRALNQDFLTTSDQQTIGCFYFTNHVSTRF
ncbi:Uncharacterised protein [Vibrio cholerae]|nr:Uncharacterised protein [Vibrio cholerae]CSI31791.1 Uncharacterised protein [Vibrio cholerae]